MLDSESEHRRAEQPNVRSLPSLAQSIVRQLRSTRARGWVERKFRLLMFGVVVSINLVLGFVSPPVGIALCIAAAVSGRPGQICLWAIPYVVVIGLVLLLLRVYPPLTLALVR